MRFNKSCLFQIVFTAIICFTSIRVSAQDSISKYDHLINAIGMVESGMNDNAKNGVHAGFLQISKIMVKDLNIRLKQRGSSKRYTLSDRFSHEKSVEMYRLFMNIYKPKNDQQAILMWNEGISAKRKPLRNTKYYRKVMRILNK